MQITAPATEDDVITAILEAELHMKRHDYKYSEILKDVIGHKLPEGFFTRADYADSRRKVLSAGRGWPDKRIFHDFPQCDWDWGLLEAIDLAYIDYIYYDYWDALSGGSHRLSDGAAAVAAGQIVYEQPNKAFWDIERLTKDGKRFPPLVLIRNQRGRFTLVEGHTRATGFALAGMVPKHQPVVLGTPRYSTNWSEEEK